MNEKLHKNLSGETECLSEQSLFAYIDDKLSQQQRYAVEKHLVDCELCSDALEGLKLVKSRAVIEDTKAHVKETFAGTERKDRKVIWFDFNYKLAAAASIALLICSVFILNHFLNKEENITAYKTISKTDQQPAPPPAPLNETKSGESENKLQPENNSPNKTQISSNAPQKNDLALKKTSSGTGITKSSKDQMMNKEQSSGAVSAPQQAESEPDQSITSEQAVQPKAKTSAPAGISAVAGAPQKGEFSADDAKEAYDKKAALEKNQKLEKQMEEEVQRRALSQEMEKSAKKKSRQRSASAAPEVNKPVAQNYSLADISTDISPQFPGGEVEQQKFINSTIDLKNCPNCTGSVSVSVTVTANGELQDPEIIKDISGCDCLGKEALRLVKAMPKWEPGKKDGKAVSSKHIISIGFK